MIRRARLLSVPVLVLAAATASHRPASAQATTTGATITQSTVTRAASAASASVDTAPAPLPRRQFAALSARQVDTTALATVSAIPDDRLAVNNVVVLKAHAETLRPAPLPDPDMDAPGPNPDQIAAEDQASLHPSFYSNSKHFAGDGYAAGSTLENDQNNRRKPAGVMSLSIPMQ